MTPTPAPIRPPVVTFRSVAGQQLYASLIDTGLRMVSTGKDGEDPILVAIGWLLTSVADDYQRGSATYRTVDYAKNVASIYTTLEMEVEGIGTAN